MVTIHHPTPTLKGKEAERFEKQAEANKKKCASKKEVWKAVKTFISCLHASLKDRRGSK